MDIINIARKRSVLFSARIRFSPETQPIRETAIDKIVEQNLLIANCEKGLTLREIEQMGVVSFANGTSALSRRDMQNSLRRLVEQNRVTTSKISTQERFRLSDSALEELDEIQRSTEKHFTEVVNRLFRDAKEGCQVYMTPFLECLCIIFSKLGENYVRLMKGELNNDEILRLPIINYAIAEIKQKYASIDKTFFETTLFLFFKDSDPSYDKIKWNMAQNYYIAKALGSIPSGHILSEELFGNAIFYLDTNVIIDALEPRTRYHKSFESLSRICQKLQIELKVCQISLDELRGVVGYNREVISKVIEKIPEDAFPKVRSVFFELYREQIELKGSVDWDELFVSFLNPKAILAKSYNVEILDDPWFLEAEKRVRKNEILLNEIKQAYQLKRGRAKRTSSAIHDTLLLEWIQLARGLSSRNVWLVTLDASLPGHLPKSEGKQVQPLAITLDALLQWIAPITSYDSSEDEFSAIFAEAVKYQLLPQERFLELRDFLMFAEMKLSCKELPTEDVEACIRHVKANAPYLDPSNPVDREKLSHQISKFFADPGRKYKQEVQKLETEIARISEEAKNEIANVKKETEEMQNEFNHLVGERDERINRLEKEARQRKEEKEKQIMKKSALRRVKVVSLLFLTIEAIVIILASKYGEGANTFEKILKSWDFLALGFSINVILSWFVIGKKRIRILGWPFSKLFSSE